MKQKCEHEVQYLLGAQFVVNECRANDDYDRWLQRCLLKIHQRKDLVSVDPILLAFRLAEVAKAKHRKYRNRKLTKQATGDIIDCCCSLWTYAKNSGT